MQSQLKIKRCFRNWQGILVEENVDKSKNKKLAWGTSFGDSSWNPRQHVTSRMKLNLCFRNWQGIYHNKKNTKRCFRDWQGIYLGDMNFEEEYTVRNTIAAQSVPVAPPTSQAQMTLRRCYKNWQGIYLNFMNFEQQVPIVPEKIVIVEPQNKKDVKKTKDTGTDPEIHPYPIIDTRLELKPDLTTKIELTYQTLDPIIPNNSNDSYKETIPKIDQTTPKPTSQIERHFNTIEPFQKETKPKRRRYTGEFVTKIPTHVNHSFSTPVKSEGSLPSELQLQHKQYLINYIDNHPTAVLNEAFESFTREFEGLGVKKSAIQNFIKEECNIKVLQTDTPNRKEINAKINVQYRTDWVNTWGCSDMDFTKNCVFIECPKLHVVMKSGGLPNRKPELKVTPRYFFVAISTFGIIETHMFHPAVKREDPYVDFIHFILDKLDQYPERKGNYIVMNGMHDWLLDDLEEIIHDRGYQCAYLPPCPAALNPITEFWKAVRYGIRRQYLYEGETIADRINESRHNLSKDTINGFIQYSKLYFKRYQNKP